MSEPVSLLLLVVVVEDAIATVGTWALDGLLLWSFRGEVSAEAAGYALKEPLMWEMSAPSDKPA
jgi:hypothetical protein